MDKKILIIDDHDEIRTAVVYLLKNADKNYTVLDAKTADEGLKLLKEHPDIQVIILDIIMPVKNGIQVLFELNGKLENLRIIVLSGYPAKLGADEAKNLGVFRYLPKPPEEEPMIFSIESAFSDIKNKNLERELKLTEQWKALGILSADFVHWVGNKVSLIPNYLELIQEEVEELSESSTNRCQKIRKVVEEIIYMKATLLLPFKEPESETVSLNDVMKQAVASCKLSKDMVREDYGLKSPKVIFNKVELGKIFEELIRNALSAMENSPQKLLTINIQDGVENEVLVKVKDTGCGIKKTDQDKIFRAFYSKKNSKGYGVGLFMVRNTLAKFGGTIKCLSKPDEGAEFIISLKKKDK